MFVVVDSMVVSTVNCPKYLSLNQPVVHRDVTTVKPYKFMTIVAKKEI